MKDIFCDPEIASSIDWEQERTSKLIAATKYATSKIRINSHKYGVPGHDRNVAAANTRTFPVEPVIVLYWQRMASANPSTSRSCRPMQLGALDNEQRKRPGTRRRRLDGYDSTLPQKQVP